MFSLLEMLATGTVGPIAPGVSEHDVRRTFGSPSDMSANRDPSVWKYDALEVTITGGRVELLHLELDQPLPSFLGADGLTRETTLDDLEQLLNSRQVPREPYLPLTFEPEQTALLIGQSRSIAVFVDGTLATVSSGPLMGHS